MFWTILFGLLDKVATFALSFLIIGVLIKVLLWCAWKINLTKDKGLLANKTATYIWLILSVIVAVMYPKLLAKALYF